MLEHQKMASHRADKLSTARFFPLNHWPPFRDRFGWDGSEFLSDHPCLPGLFFASVSNFLSVLPLHTALALAALCLLLVFPFLFLPLPTNPFGTVLIRVQPCMSGRFCCLDWLLRFCLFVLASSVQQHTYITYYICTTFCCISNHCCCCVVACWLAALLLHWLFPLHTLIGLHVAVSLPSSSPLEVGWQQQAACTPQFSGFLCLDFIGVFLWASGLACIAYTFLWLFSSVWLGARHSEQCYAALCQAIVSLLLTGLWWRSLLLPSFSLLILFPSQEWFLIVRIEIHSCFGIGYLH